jgi:NAD(P)H-hydrate epimerase
MVLAGTDGNGGGALVCARRLHNWGAQVQVFLSRAEENFTPIPAHQLDIERRMGIRTSLGQELINIEYPDLVIDGLIGYSLKGAPHGMVANLIRWSNQQSAPVLALDTPSGVDTTNGRVFDPAIRATATMTLALPKDGLRASNVQGFVGELYIADIRVPPELYEQIVPRHIVRATFAESDIIRLW